MVCAANQWSGRSLVPFRAFFFGLFGARPLGCGAIGAVCGSLPVISSQGPIMIKQGTVVSMTYRLTNAAGEELDRADKNEPFSYLHGAGQIVPGLEKALAGALVGTQKKVVVSPEEGYGEVEERLRTSAKRNQFPPDAELTVGMRFAADDGSGQPIIFTVTELVGDDVSLDGNHPLAGETLHFDVEVVEVREATAEELQHGHAHGPGGHHHD